MKTECSYFKQKNTKRGMALSTVMAIGIVLVLFVAILVSIATLNITTTQATVNQRDAYVKAKSAIAFAESYYMNNQDEIPGVKAGATEGQALILFRDGDVSQGGEVYVTKQGTTPESGFSPAAIQSLESKAEYPVYLEVSYSGKLLLLTAYVKYGENDAYQLSKQIDLTDKSEAEGNAFTGNIVYEPVGDTRYLRIHVRTAEAFTYEPYIYAWGPNSSAEATSQKSSSLVNKMARSSNYPEIKYAGEWKGSEGPTSAMTYEGNGWYVYEIEIGQNTNIEYINAIITRKGANRAEGNESQTWEFFGIPVPPATQTGKANGNDVYITLNQTKLRDARNWTNGTTYTSGSETYSSTGSEGDELSKFWQIDGSSNYKDFAKFSNKYYSVFMKRNTYTIHYRKQDVYDDSVDMSGAGYEYEGYGWWRKVVHDGSYTETFGVNGDTYCADWGKVISENDYGGEVVKELFVCERADGDATECFGDGYVNPESAANDWFVSNGDTKAGDYVTINVKATDAPVDQKVTTTLNYETEWIETSTPLPTPGDVSTDTNTDTDTETTVVAYDEEELEVVPLSINNNKLGAQLSGAKHEEGSTYYVVGDFNGWGGGEQNFKYCTPMEENGDNTHYKVTISAADWGNTRPDGKWDYKILRKGPNDGDTWDWREVWQWPGSGNNSFNLGDNNAVEFYFDLGNDSASANPITVGDPDPDTDPGPDPDTDTEVSGTKYCVIGTIGEYNNWGKNSSGTGTAYYRYTNEMTYSDGKYVYEITNVPGSTYYFKILPRGGDDDEVKWDSQWGGDKCSGDFIAATDIDRNCVLALEGGVTTKYTVRITFDGNNITVSATETSNSEGGNYYVIGTWNNWADGHNYAAATSDLYKMTYVKTQGDISYYTYDMRVQNVPASGEYEIKVFSSQAEPTDGSEQIDYSTYSWGKVDSTGSSMGAAWADSDEGRPAYSYGLDEPSRVIITFELNTADPTASRITRSVTPYDIHSITTKQVAFYNAQVENVNTGAKTSFTTPWTEVWVCYTDPFGFQRQKLTIEPGTAAVWATIPSNAENIFFANAEKKDDVSVYEYTDTFSFADLGSTANPIYFPMTSTTTTNGKMWTMGDTNTYRAWVNSVLNTTGSAEMVYTDTNRISYYNIPIVNLLEKLVHDNGGSGNYAFAASPFSKFDTKSYIGIVTFSENNFVVYQNETYYYSNVHQDGSGLNLSYSVLLVSTGESKFGILYENEFALTRNNLISGFNTGGPDNSMNNRGGATFTSTGVYQDGISSSGYGFGDYTPNWYTVKIPCSTSYTIKKITGVTANGAGHDYNNTFEATGVDDNYNQPVYINMTGSSSSEIYTYDIDNGKVDTNSSGKICVYFDKPSDWSSNIKLYAVGLSSAYDHAVSIDTKDADTNYYFAEFEAGKYAYFTFYDADTGDHSTATKKTSTLYLTGEEDKNDRSYKILASDGADGVLDGKVTTFGYYLHPRTKALYAFQEARSAYYEACIYKNYSYDDTKHVYTGNGSMLEMSKLKAAMDNASNYYNNGNSPSYSASASEMTASSDWANAARYFSKAITNARIYIAEDPITGDSNYRFPEYEYRDSILKYTTRWVNTLKVAYNDAMAVYGDTSLQNPATLYARADAINALIQNPDTIFAEDTISIIIQDQPGKDDDGNIISSPWGKNNIRLYKMSEGGTWELAGQSIYDTTQSSEGYYAFLFKGDTTAVSGERYQICKGSVRPDDSNPEEGHTLLNGKRYFFNTATEEWSEDKSVPTITFTGTEIVNGGTNEEWGMYESPVFKKPFVVYFMYDTEVEISPSEKYTILAGAYTISDSYTNFHTDLGTSATLTGNTGINLFTEHAQLFFTYGFGMDLTRGSEESPKAWTSTLLAGTSLMDDEQPETNKNCEIYCSSLSATELEAVNDYRVNMRTPNQLGSDKLDVTGKVTLDAPVVTLACNNLNIAASARSGHFMIENAKTVIFYTDVHIKLSDGTEYGIRHGTYVLASGVSTASIDLTDPDWVTNYILINGLDSELGGGMYVATR